MINIEVFSEEKAWSKKIKKKELFFKQICKLFPRKYKFPNKKIISAQDAKNSYSDFFLKS